MTSNVLIDQAIYQLVAADGSQTLLLSVQGDWLRYRTVPSRAVKASQKLIYLHDSNGMLKFGAYPFIDTSKTGFAVYLAPEGAYEVDQYWGSTGLDNDALSVVSSGKLYSFVSLVKYCRYK